MNADKEIILHQSEILSRSKISNWFEFFLTIPSGSILDFRKPFFSQIFYFEEGLSPKKYQKYLNPYD